MPMPMGYAPGPQAWQKGGLSWLLDQEQAYGQSWTMIGGEPNASNCTQGMALRNSDPWDLGPQPTEWMQQGMGDPNIVKGQEWETPEQLEHRSWAQPGENSNNPQNWMWVEEKTQGKVEAPSTDVQRIATMLEQTMSNQECIILQRKGKGVVGNRMSKQNWAGGEKWGKGQTQRATGPKWQGKNVGKKISNKPLQPPQSAGGQGTGGNQAYNPKAMDDAKPIQQKTLGDKESVNCRQLIRLIEEKWNKKQTGEGVKGAMTDSRTKKGNMDGKIGQAVGLTKDGPR